MGMWLVLTKLPGVSEKNLNIFGQFNSSKLRADEVVGFHLRHTQSSIAKLVELSHSRHIELS
jgi:hypothetical protein